MSGVTESDGLRSAVVAPDDKLRSAVVVPPSDDEYYCNRRAAYLCMPCSICGFIFKGCMLPQEQCEDCIGGKSRVVT